MRIKLKGTCRFSDVTTSQGTVSKEWKDFPDAFTINSDMEIEGHESLPVSVIPVANNPNPIITPKPASTSDYASELKALGFNKEVLAYIKKKYPDEEGLIKNLTQGKRVLNIDITNRLRNHYGMSSL